MPQFNLPLDSSIDENYAHGLLPQRNQKNLFYKETSSRSNLHNFSISSENRRIINKTNQYSFQIIPLDQFNYDLSVQKTIYMWIKDIGWDFPISSVKKIFTDHIFNHLYIWKNEKQQIIAYSICYFSEKISHIAYVFYNPEYSHNNLPIRLTLQVVVDSHEKSLGFCYLGRFSEKSGFYKRTMPGFEYFKNGYWVKH